MSNSLEEKKLEILYDHYKDTFENIKSYLQKRNIYTISTILLVGVLSIELTLPNVINDISNQLIKKNIGEIKIDYNLISSIVIFVLMWSILLYYQINFLIEKMYAYIHKIEENLSKEIEPYEIGREGKNYLNNYPILSSVAHRIYTILFPITILIVVITKWFSEKLKAGENWLSGNFLFNSLILLLIVIITLLYLSNRHFNDFKKEEEKVDEEKKEEEKEKSSLDEKEIEDKKE